MPTRRLTSPFAAVLALAALATLAALPARAQAQPPSGAEKELIDLENTWAEAMVKADAPALERLFSDEYLAIDPMGGTNDKAQDIANVKSGKLKLESYKLDDVKVRVHGTIAVVTGRDTLKGSYEGKDISGAYRFTDTFVKRSGHWQVLTTQGTKVAPQ